MIVSGLGPSTVESADRNGRLMATNSSQTVMGEREWYNNTWRSKRVWLQQKNAWCGYNIGNGSVRGGARQPKTALQSGRGAVKSLIISLCGGPNKLG